jgi:hypothetical protein
LVARCVVWALAGFVVAAGSHDRGVQRGGAVSRVKILRTLVS